MPVSFLRALGVIGWDRLEPVVLAALATEDPLLLIGPHGTAKSLLLTRLATALGLEARHYNASLVNFDDLIGFPVPEDGKLTYLQTPSTIWDAEVVFFDEVSRCRPELQNKLFPIVHERVVQGLPLTKLRHRWAAMNPPPNAESPDEAVEYAGAEPLDVALADRFGFIVPVPTLETLSRTEQLQVLGIGDEPSTATSPGGAGSLRDVVATIRASLAATSDTLRAAAAEYVQLLAQRLAQAGHPLSTRRAVQLTRNIVSVRAVLTVTGEAGSLEDAFHGATRYSLPDAAWGRPVDPSVLLAAHRAAWEVAQLHQDCVLKELLSEPSPTRRIRLALHRDIPATDAGRIVADSFSSLPALERLAVAALVMPRLTRRTDLPVSAVELVARDYASLAETGEAGVTVRRGGADWKRDILGRHLAEIDRRTRRGRHLTNIAVALMSADEEFRWHDLVTAYDRAADELGEAVTRRKKERAA